MADRVGERLRNYHLVRKLGEGKTGVVYLGEDSSSKVQRAIKLLPNIGMMKEQEHFLAAARRIANLDHPNLVRLLDFFIYDQTPVLVLRYTPWGNLLQYHPKGVQLPLERILPYLQDCAEALHYLHDRGVLHLDVKPENLLLGPQAEAWLSNVGLGTLLHPYTRDGKPTRFFGTPLYAAPEQFQSEPNQASDQYALAVTACRWLTGRFPWKGDLATISAQKRYGPPPLREQAPWLASRVAQILLRALVPAPSERFPSVRAFVEALASASQPPTKLLSPGLLLSRHSNPNWVKKVAWSPNGRQIASVAGLGPLQVWDPTTGQNLVAFSNWHSSGEFKAWELFAWSPDGRRIAAGSENGNVQVWGVAPGQPLVTYHGHSGWVRALAWSPDGRQIASTSEYGLVQVWDTITGERLVTYSGHPYLVAALGWSSDGGLIASSSESGNSEIHVWRVITGKRMLVYRRHSCPVLALEWSPKGRLIASASGDKTVQIWEGETGKCLLTYRGHTHAVRTVAWSPDNTRIVSGSSDGTLQVWEATTGARLVTYTGHFLSKVNAVAWSPDGTRIASAGDDRTVQIWQAP